MMAGMTALALFRPTPGLAELTDPLAVARGAPDAVLTAADVIGPSLQGIAAGNFAGLIASMRAGVTYVNIHTTAHPGGEIRGAIISDED